jgi:hypothetical protein
VSTTSDSSPSGDRTSDTATSQDQSLGTRLGSSDSGHADASSGGS